MSHAHDRRVQKIDRLLADWSNGSSSAGNELMSLIGDDLKAIASRFLFQRAPSVDLETGEIVNEIFIRLLQNPSSPRFPSYASFLSYCSLMVKNYLFNYQRSTQTEKRGKGYEHVSLEQGPSTESCIEDSIEIEDLIDLDGAMKRLSDIDNRQYNVILLHFMLGYSLMEIGEFLGISLATVKRDLSIAKSFLARQLGNETGG